LSKPGKQQEHYIAYSGVNISINTKKLLFYRVIETISSYGWEIWTLDYKLKKKLLSTEMSFWRTAVRTKSNYRINGCNTIMERMDYKMLKQYGHVVSTKDNR
jgi:hypothetical protein